MYHYSMKFIRIFLLILIIISIILLLTRDIWVQPLVEKIIKIYPAKHDSVMTTIPLTEKLFEYRYECDEHVSIGIVFLPDITALRITSTREGTFPATTTLLRMPTAKGTRYEGGDIILTARGETVTLGEGDSAINCSPVAVPDEAPFNFGD